MTSSDDPDHAVQLMHELIVKTLTRKEGRFQYRDIRQPVNSFYDADMLKKYLARLVKAKELRRETDDLGRVWYT